MASSRRAVRLGHAIPSALRSLTREGTLSGGSSQVAVNISWPTPRVRRLDAGMAEERARRAPAEPSRRRGEWSAERVAGELVPRREELVEQLPRELARARGLTRDQRELVVDEAIDYLVTEYAKPI